MDQPEPGSNRNRTFGNISGATLNIIVAPGGAVGSSANYGMSATAGQTTVGAGESENYQMSQGCWPDFGMSCCVGRVGDANGLGGDQPTIGDVSSMIDALFIGGDFGVIECLAEADINQSGGTDPLPGDITIGDISTLIDYLFITGPSIGLAECL